MSIVEIPFDSTAGDADRTGPVPLWLQLASRLEGAITSGELATGARLENEVAMAERLGLSRPTVRRAIQELVDKGLVVRRRRVGTQVVQGRVRRKVELTSLFDDLTRSGQHPSTTVLSFEVVAADAKVAAALDVPAGSEVLHLRRLRLADGVPVALLDNHLPSRPWPFTADQLAQRSLYALMREAGATLQVARQTIGARRASDQEADELDIERGDPVLVADRITYDNAGNPIELGSHCYRPDLYSFEVTLVNR